MQSNLTRFSNIRWYWILQNWSGKFRWNPAPLSKYEIGNLFDICRQGLATAQIENGLKIFLKSWFLTAWLYGRRIWRMWYCKNNFHLSVLMTKFLFCHDVNKCYSSNQLTSFTRRQTMYLDIHVAKRLSVCWICLYHLATLYVYISIQFSSIINIFVILYIILSKLCWLVLQLTYWPLRSLWRRLTLLCRDLKRLEAKFWI